MRMPFHKRMLMMGAPRVSFAQPTAPDANLANRNKLWFDKSANKLKVCVRSFHNEGTDYGDWGHPAALVSLLAPNNAYTVQLVCDPTVSQTSYPISLNGGPGFNQFGVIQEPLSASFRAGDTSVATVATAATGLRELVAVSDGVNRRIIANGVVSTPRVNGSDLYSGNLYIGGRTDGATANFEGETYIVSFKTASGQIVDSFNANILTQWDGGATAISSAGNPITFTDGTPFGRTAFSWIDYASAIAWGIL